MKIKEYLKKLYQDFIKFSESFLLFFVFFSAIAFWDYLIIKEANLIDPRLGFAMLSLMYIIVILATIVCLNKSFELGYQK